MAITKKRGSLLQSVGAVLTLVFLIGVEPDAAEPLNSDPETITLYVSVYDSQGKPIETLKASDFTVLEEKKPQSLVSFGYERNTPISLGILVDISRTMGSGRIDFALGLLKDLARRLESPDEIFVNAFSVDSQELMDFVSPEDYLDDSIDHLGTGGRPHMGLAVDLGLIKLRESRNQKRALLLISTGKDIAGRATLDHIAQNRYPIYALGLKGTAGLTGALEQLKVLNVKGSALKVFADRSGGNAIFVDTEPEAQQALDSLCFDMKSQYRLEYVPSNRKRDGKSRDIAVKTSNKDFEVRHLRKYIAPRQ